MYRNAVMKVLPLKSQVALIVCSVTSQIIQSQRVGRSGWKCVIFPASTETIKNIHISSCKPKQQIVKDNPKIEKDNHKKRRKDNIIDFYWKRSALSSNNDDDYYDLRL